MKGSSQEKPLFSSDHGDLLTHGAADDGVELLLGRQHHCWKAEC
jgi:hypothetical protein